MEAFSIHQIFKHQPDHLPITEGLTIMTHTDNQRGEIYGTSLLILFVVAFAFYGCKDVVSHFTSKEHKLLMENDELKKTISNLTEETQIGYAKVISQKKIDGRLFTRIKFVETDRIDNFSKVLEKEYEIEGDVIHFDCLIVKFAPQMVMDGKEKSLYLWRRVYGEKMNPSNGYPIEIDNEEPKRYSDILKNLSIKDRDQFWSEIWQLSNDPDRLKEKGIQAIYGNVVYNNLKPNLVYVFKINNSGCLYPEVFPDF